MPFPMHLTEPYPFHLPKQKAQASGNLSSAEEEHKFIREGMQTWQRYGPVCSHPSESIISAVADGLLRYPFISWGPRTHISPWSLAAHSSPLSTFTNWHEQLQRTTSADKQTRKDNNKAITILLVAFKQQQPI